MIENKEVKTAILTLVGTDGLERIEAMARLLPQHHNYREAPELLACHLLDVSIERVEKNILEFLGLVTPSNESEKGE